MRGLRNFAATEYGPLGAALQFPDRGNGGGFAYFAILSRSRAIDEFHSDGRYYSEMMRFQVPANDIQSFPTTNAFVSFACITLPLPLPFPARER